MNADLRRGVAAVTATLLGCVPAAGPQAGGDPTPAARGAIVAGSPDTDHAAVGAIGVRRQGCSEALSSFCSGTLIAPDVVLTAGHCFKGEPAWQVYEVMFAADTRRAGVSAYVTQVLVHPDFDDATHTADVALLRLAAPVTVTPARLPEAGILPARVDDPVTVVGFGQTAALDPASSGQRRQGTSQISAISDASFSVRPGPGLSCDGDSGGGLFVDDPAGPILVGVTNTGDSSCQGSATNARVDAYVGDFIAPFVRAGRTSPERPSDPAQLCSMPCSTAVDCPAGLACIPSASGGYCGVGGLPPGSFGDGCLYDKACPSETCVRLAFGTDAGACRCYSPCTPAIGPSDGGAIGPSDGIGETDGSPTVAPPSGCAFAPTARFDLFGLLVALAFIVCGRRRARNGTKKRTPERTPC
jgi:hypothetical protein